MIAGVMVTVTVTALGRIRLAQAWMALLDFRWGFENGLFVRREEWASASWDLACCYGLALGLGDAYDAR